jgi:hypothetical protein
MHFLLALKGDLGLCFREGQRKPGLLPVLEFKTINTVRTKMRSPANILVLLLWALSAQARDLQVAVVDSGSKEVDALVLQLVSERPAPYPSGYWETSAEADMATPYMTPQVKNAIAKLKMMGTGVFPALMKHRGDDRYSFSGLSAAWANYSVGDAVIEILCDGHYMHSGYKVRETPSGSAVYLSFEGYLAARGPEKWADWAKTKTRLDIQMDFIDWCVAQEQDRGFTEESQRKRILDIYQQARERVRKEYSEPGGPAAGSQPLRSATNRTSSAAGSPR